MVTETHADGVQTVLLTRPYVGPILGPMWWKNWGADYNVATAEVAAEERVPVVDLYSIFRENPQLVADESHYTPDGHAVAAALFRDVLEPLIPR